MTDDDLRAYFRDRLQERAELLAVHAWLSRQATVTDGEIERVTAQTRAAAKMTATSAHFAGRPDRERIALDVLAVLGPEPDDDDDLEDDDLEDEGAVAGE